MKKFNQKYRTLSSLFFLCVFLSISVIDFSCFIGRVGFASSNSHSHGDSHNHSHSVSKIILASNVATVKDNSCCKEEVMGYYSAIKKIVVSKVSHVDLPIDLFIYFEHELPTFTDEESYIQPLLICNKAPPFVIEHIYLNNSILII